MVDPNKIIQKVSPYYEAKKEPSIKYKLVYDTPSGTLEPLYFWLLDFMQAGGGEVKKIVDNFASSPGSGHFSELGLKKSQMQDQASKIMATINSVLRSVLNLIYDLKEFKIRLTHYEVANSKDPHKSEAGLLTLKQIWMDKVDIQRGQGSINALSSGNLQFVTLRDAFLKAKDEKDVEKIDLNERVKRILKPRILEFLEWKNRSYEELKKRFEIEKTYLKSQVSALKLQARWAKPYLDAAEKLAQEENLSEDAALVTAFNTVLLQLTLMSKRKLGVEGQTVKSRIADRSLPEEFENITKKLRPYYSITLIDFKFTGIPNKIGQQYVFGGKAEMEFKAYALNEEEIMLFEEELKDSDLASALKLVQGMTDDSLKELKIDISTFIDEKEEGKKTKTNPNPFTALFSFERKNKKSDEEIKIEKIEKLKEKKVKKDSYAERYVRTIAEANAMSDTFKVYDTFKKSLLMAAAPTIKGDPTINTNAPKTKADNFFGF